MSDYVLPIIILVLTALAAGKRVNVYECFSQGAQEAVKLTLTVFPFICAIFVAVYLFRASGLEGYVGQLAAPLLDTVGIPRELVEIIILKPLSGNGSIGILEEIYMTYGADSYISRAASVIMNSGETVFYVAAVYLSTTRVRRLRGSMTIALTATLFGAIFSCILCRIM